jgi:cytochrome bd-type quinol oxidase subunit 2
VLTIADGGGARATLTSLLIVFGIAVVVVVPSIVLLYTLTQRSLIEEGERPQPHVSGI